LHGIVNVILERMILLIDVGNTRLKWAWHDGAGLSEQQAVVHRNHASEQWTVPLFGPTQEASRVLVCNVAGPAMAKSLTELSQRKFSLDPEFITANRNFGQLTNGYLDPELLGADRWLAVIGAWTRLHSALCIIDAGTAVKVDAVDGAGRHQGGLIVPGIHMMRDALFRGTTDIARAAELSTASTSGVLANNTIGAVGRGAVFALAGMADHAIDLIVKDTGIEPALLITGGDAELISSSLHRHGEIIPDLVLQGLSAIATAPAMAPQRQGIS
jgi:type III pantothenate kinase